MARTLTWVAPSGARLLLTDRAAGRRVLRSTRGLGVAPTELVTEDTPSTDGTSVVEVRVQPRPVTLPMLLSAPDRATFLSRVRELTSLMDPAAGPGWLELQQSDGTVRRLRCRYAAGLEGDEGDDLGGDIDWWRFAITLFAADPYFVGDPVTLVYSNAASTKWFPIFPLRLGSSRVLGQVVLDNPGDAPAPPIITVTPPGSALLLQLATGARISAPAAIPAGRTLTIDTTPGRQSARLSDGTDWWPQLDPTSVLWQVPPGQTSALLSLSDAAAGSSITLSFSPRYRSPW